MEGPDPGGRTDMWHRQHEAEVGHGPYELGLGLMRPAGFAQAADDGYPIREPVEHFHDGPMVPAPKLDGAVVLSHRDSDLELGVGEEPSIGYTGHG